MKEWIFLKPKMYSMLAANGKGKKTAKAVKKIVIKKGITHDDYKHIITDKIELYREMQRTFVQNKRSLLYWEDKWA